MAFARDPLKCGTFCVFMIQDLLTANEVHSSGKSVHTFYI